MSKNTFGNALKITLFGESHGAAIGAVIDGITPGIQIDEDFINHRLNMRRPAGKISTTRQEKDAWQMVSGVFEGRTTGTPICIVIPNEDTRSRDYSPQLARPSHADYAAQCKYHGCQDYRGGGHFSGRLTAALVAVGGILLPALKAKGIEIGTHLCRCAGIEDAPLDAAAMGDETVLREQLRALSDRAFPTLNESAGERMIAAIEAARLDADSVGGISNGMPVTFRCAVKPTASIYKEQPTVDIYNRKEGNIIINGRHDPCIAHRARVVVDSMAAIVVADALLQRYGNDALK